MCLSRSAVREHQRLQPGVEHERRHGVDELRLEQLDGRHLGEQEAPRVPVAEVDLLQVLVELALREQVALIGRLLGEEAHLREVGGSRRHRARRARRVEHGLLLGLEHVVAANPGRRPEQPLHLGGEGELGRALELEHVAVELGRPADGLAGVVDDVVEPVVGREQVVAELLDARRVAQVEAVDLEPVLPVGEIGLLGVAGGRVAREARRHDQVGAGAEQLDPRLVADLDAAARQHGDAALEVGGLGALREVELGARRAELVVERMQLAVRLLADVAVLLLVRRSRALRLVAIARRDPRARSPSAGRRSAS